MIWWRCCSDYAYHRIELQGAKKNHTVTLHHHTSRLLHTYFDRIGTDNILHKGQAIVATVTAVSKYTCNFLIVSTSPPLPVFLDEFKVYIVVLLIYIIQTFNRHKSLDILCYKLCAMCWRKLPSKANRSD
jgi:hypothetical protein